ncbi:MAG TPA: hypothetical protein VM581_02450 [Magnetospirillaceae bacterium]|nr:hypothetical protein [Magnetospirillaceae bacterium]
MILNKKVWSRPKATPHSAAEELGTDTPSVNEPSDDRSQKHDHHQHRQKPGSPLPLLLTTLLKVSFGIKKPLIGGFTRTVRGDSSSLRTGRVSLLLVFFGLVIGEDDGSQANKHPHCHKHSRPFCITYRHIRMHVGGHRLRECDIDHCQINEYEKAHEQALADRASCSQHQANAEEHMCLPSR